MRKAADAPLRAGGVGLERPEREDAARVASLPRYWIDPHADSEIEACGHDLDSAAPAGEEMAVDACGTLLRAASLYEQTREGPEGEELAGEIRRVADFCGSGSRDELARGISEAGLDHAGRNSAIMMSGRAGRGRGVCPLPGDGIVSAFPGNPGVAGSLPGDTQNARGGVPPAWTEAARTRILGDASHRTAGLRGPSAATERQCPVWARFSRLLLALSQKNRPNAANNQDLDNFWAQL